MSSLASPYILTAYCLLPSAYCSSRMRHLFRLHVLVELRARQQAQRNRSVAQRDALLVRVLGDLGGVVVADVRVQSGDEHERLAQVFVNLRAVEFDAGDAVINEAVTGVFQEADRMEQVVDQHRLEDVQLEVALRAGETDGRVVA